MFCKENRIEQVIIETDFMAMVQILEGKWEISWSVSLEVNSINRLMSVLSVRVQHSLREGNALADFFANMIFNFAIDFQIYQLQYIPSEDGKILHMDKAGTPQIRRKITAI